MRGKEGNSTNPTKFLPLHFVKDNCNLRYKSPGIIYQKMLKLLLEGVQILGLLRSPLDLFLVVPVPSHSARLVAIQVLSDKAGLLGE